MQAQLVQQPVDGQVDVVAAARTVLVTVREARQLAALAARLRSIDASVPVERDASSPVTVEVLYDGADLADVAALTGLSEEAVISAHTSQPWVAAFGGFAPGFAYLTGGDPRLEVPRRASPRTAVPAGSVALAGMFSAVYPRRSPGGWQLVGRTEAVLWDTDRPEPALIRPGARVQFVAVRELIGIRTTSDGGAVTEDEAVPGVPVGQDAPIEQPVLPAGSAEGSPAGRPATGTSDGAGSAGLIVLVPGLSSTLQDLGRPGLMSVGVAGSGALDRFALRQANRLVGNEAGEAVIESVLGGLTLEARGSLILAVTGADVGLLITRPDGGERTAPLCAPFLLREGEVLRQTAPAWGLRSYTAVRGGFGAGTVLGSRSTDALSGLGPAILAVGDELPVRPAPRGSAVGPSELPRVPRTPEVLRILPGPRDDWFDDDALSRLCAGDWTVTAQSNRVGLRLDGPALERTRLGELPSEGTVKGALQVPPSGLPVLFLADHPVTGGYPVIAVVVSADLDRAAQLPPGSLVRFRETEQDRRHVLQVPVRPR
jgi:KipI family sensor histidine kinase inhibitor